MSLDTKGRFETGLKCLSTFGSSEFFSEGVLQRLISYMKEGCQ